MLINSSLQKRLAATSNLCNAAYDIVRLNLHIISDKEFENKHVCYWKVNLPLK